LPSIVLGFMGKCVYMILRLCGYILHAPCSNETANISSIKTQHK
jgi:hypothetical protein